MVSSEHMTGVIRSCRTVSEPRSAEVTENAGPLLLIQEVAWASSQIDDGNIKDRTGKSHPVVCDLRLEVTQL